MGRITGTHPAALLPARSTRGLRAATVALGAALLLAACASAPDASDAADAPTPGTGYSAALGSCLRDAGHDVDDADLVPGVVAVPDGVDPESYMADFDRCRGELPPELGGGAPPEVSADDVAARQEAGLAIARCVREAGFPDFADPVDGEFGMMSVEQTPENEAFLACDEQHGLDAGTEASR